MTGKLALNIYKNYYKSLKFYFYVLNNCNYNCNYKEFIKSFFAELENSEIPDWARFHFVTRTINYPKDFDSIYFANLDLMLNQCDDESRSEKWIAEQQEALKQTAKVVDLAEERVKNKRHGTIYQDEEKYDGFIELLEKTGGLFKTHIFDESTDNIIKLYVDLVTQGRLYGDKIVVIREKATVKTLNKDLNKKN